MAGLSLEECELLGDSKYRAYISQVDKALKNFEYTSEWADLISALAKLNKVLLNHVKYPVIPKRVTIGKRLAQCLHPALPSGVHLKAIETYDIIFKCIGTQRLAADLFTYSAGLFPLLGHSAMSVKPALLKLYESHFVPLGKHIKPALTGLLIGLLPGLEEGSEHFERTSNLLEDFCEACSATYFYGCLWECVQSNPSVRLPAINFVLAHFNRKQTLDDQLHLAGSNVDVLVGALCLAVQDSSVLVQRSTLDFLLLAFPLYHSQLMKSDLSKVVTDAVKVVLRRDMSLNRRLYAWLLGTDANGQPIHVPLSETKHSQTARSDSISTTSECDMYYFNMYSKELLVQAVKSCIREGTVMEQQMHKSAGLKPFRILISLLDKPEIGSVIVEDVLMDILRCLYQLCVQTGEIQQEDQSHRSSKKNKNGRPNPEKLSNTEVIKTANLLFSSFEPFFIWDYIARCFEGACQRTASLKPANKDLLTVTALCSIVDFLLEKISLETYAETQTVHLPELLRQITGAMAASCDTLHESEIEAGLKLCSKLLARVMPSIVPAMRDELDDDSIIDHVYTTEDNRVRKVVPGEAESVNYREENRKKKKVPTATLR